MKDPWSFNNYIQEVTPQPNSSTPSCHGCLCLHWLYSYTLKCFHVSSLAKLYFTKNIFYNQLKIYKNSRNLLPDLFQALLWVRRLEMAGDGNQYFKMFQILFLFISNNTKYHSLNLLFILWLILCFSNVRFQIEIKIKICSR